LNILNEVAKLVVGHGRPPSYSPCAASPLNNSTSRQCLGLSVASALPAGFIAPCLPIKTQKLAPGRRGAADRKFAADPRNNTVFARVTPDLLGRPMATDRYHMRAYEARRRRTLASDPSLKADLELIAQEWVALAEEVEWLERKYGPLVSPQAASHQSETVVQQQQQSQPKDEDKKD
jgi:hypothetical protein